jgi:imidazole glycerol-phosphate synthase subunit HisH
MKVAIINYQASNLHSISKAVRDLGADPLICNEPKDLKNVNKIILPGVGSFAKAMSNIIETGFFEELNEMVLLDRTPILGICLGMQLLTKSSTENKFTKGFGFIDGNVVHLKTLGCDLRLPHIGWNSIRIVKKNNLFLNIPDNSDFYFANNYALTDTDQNNVIAKANYGIDIISVIKKENIIGAQFHPEKSSSYGKLFIKNFLNFKYD